MALVLTIGSTVECPDHGAASKSSTAKLSVGGLPVLIAASVKGQSITQCPVADDANTLTKKCRTVLSVQGASLKLQSNGAAVLLTSLTGTTDGTPPATGKPLGAVTAGQQKLQAT